MPRRSRHPELSLLLAVAPLVGGCDGPEDRRCVGPDGVYLQDACCEAAASCHVAGSHYVHVPRRHCAGVGFHSGAWRSHTSPSPSPAIHQR